MKSRASSEMVGAFVTGAILVGLLVAFYAIEPVGALAFGLGLIAAVDTGILGAIIIFLLQTPTFTVWSAEDEWDKKSKWKFIHVWVRNDATNFLGGGVAADLRGSISVDGGAQGYIPKWVDKAEPIDQRFVPTAQGLAVGEVIDPSLIKEAERQTLNPGEQRLLDIAVKVADDELCYIHEADNYRFPDHKKNPFPVADHRVSLVLKWGAREDGPFEFILKNGGGKSPDTLSLKPANPKDRRTAKPEDEKRG